MGKGFRKRHAILSLISAFLTFVPGVTLKAAVPVHDEMDRARAWVKENFSSSWPAAKLPPFSFLYGGKPSGDLLKGWRLRVSPETRRAAETQQSYCYTDPATGLEVTSELTRYDDFPAVEWVLNFKNTGHKPTPILQDVRALNLRFQNDGGNFVLHWALGSNAGPTDFIPVDQTLAPGAQVSIAPVGGRSSNTTALPFFNLRHLELKPTADAEPMKNMVSLLFMAVA